jgi:polysaccharide biosynthesis protein PslG
MRLKKESGDCWIKRLILIAVFFIISSDVRALVVDKFTTTTSTTLPQQWSFSNGPEFPGATGSVALVTGNPDNAMQINYNVSTGGQYVAATKTLTTAATALGLQFEIKHSAAVSFAVRIVDGNGQTLQYDVGSGANIPLEVADSASWHSITIKFDKPSTYWGGTSTNGVVNNGVKKISFVAQPVVYTDEYNVKTKSNTAGSITVDNINLLDGIPYTNIDTFEAAGSPVPWYATGNQVSATIASLPQGLSGKGARLTYSFSGNGAYAAAFRDFSPKLDIPMVEFSAKITGTGQLTLQVTDNYGQLLSYTPKVTGSSVVAGAWNTYRVYFDDTVNWHSGGTFPDGHCSRPISKIQVVVSGASGTSGTLDLDEVRTFALLKSTLDINSTSTVTAPSGAGDFSSRASVNLNSLYIGGTWTNTLLDRVKNAGITYVRDEVRWSELETVSGVYDWTKFDNLHNALQSRGLKWIIVLSFGNQLYTGSSNMTVPPTTTSAIAGFRAYATAVANRYKGMGYRYEIWNEQNVSNFWSPAPDPLKYALLLSETCKGIQSVDASASITSGGLISMDFPYFSKMLEEIKAKGYASPTSYGIHPYLPWALRPEATVSTYRYQNEVNWLSHGGVGFIPPLYNTEVGYSSAWYDGNGYSNYGRNIQAARVVGMYLTGWAMGCNVVSIYGLVDSGTAANDGESHYGLNDASMNEKPAMVAVRTLGNTFAKGRTYQSLIQTGLSGLHAMKLVGTTDKVLVLWSEGGGTRYEVSLTVNPGSNTFEMLGGYKNVMSSNSDSLYRVTVGEEPVYIKY